MSIAEVNDVVTKFLATKTPQVLAVSGDWGVGKTYTLEKIVSAIKPHAALQPFCSRVMSTGSAWFDEGFGFDEAFKRIFKPDRDSPTLQQFSYVSLFGLNSMAEVRTKIWTTRKRFPIGTREPSVWENWLSPRWWMTKIFSAAKEELPYGKSVVVGLESIITKIVGESIIWFDDLERLGPDINIEDFMGLVSELKERLKCKVIIVYNGKQLGRKEDYFKIYSEKVIDQTLAFEITPEEAVFFGLPVGTPLRDLAIPYVRALQVRNIRIIQRVANALSYIYPVVAGNTAAAHDRIACAVAVFTCALYESGRGFGSPDEVLKYNYYQEAMADHQRNGQVAQNEEEQVSTLAWKALLEECGFKASDELDLEVLKALSQGYVGDALIKQFADKVDATRAAEAEALPFTQAWNSYHYSFDSTPDDLAEMFIEAVRVGAAHISPGNMSGTVKLMREIDKGDVAEQLIDLYIQGCGDDVERFKPRNWRHFIENMDPTLEARLAQAVTEKHVLMTLDEAALVLIENQNWREEVLDVFAVVTVDELYELLLRNQGPKLSPLIMRILNLNVGANREQMLENLRAALQRIANQSPLNELRVRRWLNELR